ncbi:phosphopantetheine-binding protein [Micromonospora sp. NPDC049282]|uniref:phosphopantetheine-binding protein n=1 Tax=Micromonospora sp. NPDC049282 TaxID=3364269 RepID=UPI003713761F
MTTHAVPVTEADVMSALDAIFLEIKRIRRELRPEDHLVQDLDIDSLAALELLIALEARFSVNLLNDPRASTVATVAELVDVIRRQVASREPVEHGTSTIPTISRPA